MDAKKISYPIDEAFSLIGLTRTAGYRAIATGELETYKDGKRRLATHRALENYVARREQESTGKAAA